MKVVTGAGEDFDSLVVASISGDGKWVTYVLSLTNTAPTDAKPVLHLLRLDTNQDIEVANASAPAFTADSKWMAYQVDPSAGGRWMTDRRS